MGQSESHHASQSDESDEYSYSDDSYYLSEGTDEYGSSSDHDTDTSLTTDAEKCIENGSYHSNDKGNFYTHLSPSDDEIPKNVLNIAALTKDELQHRLLEIDISRQDIVSAHKLIKNDEKFPKYNEDEKLSDIAILLLQSSQELCSFRFKMVPARLSENDFWSSVFHLLQMGRQCLKNSSTTDQKGDMAQCKPVTKQLAVDHHVRKLENLEIIQLKKKLASTEKKLAEIQLENSALRNAATNCGGKQKKEASWQMDHG